jgi:hypothetical protein
MGQVIVNNEWLVTLRYPQLLTMTWPMDDEWMVYVCDQPLVIDYDLAYG